MGFREDKQARTDYYFKYVYGWKERKCGACNGSGRYDNNGSPPCSACDGTGKETYKPTKNELMELHFKNRIAKSKRAVRYWEIKLKQLEGKQC